MKTFSLFAGAALIAAAGAALAQPADGPRRDRDAEMTRQQVIERVAERFARLDLDRDGRATADEARQAHEQRRGERAGRAFERIDLDRDGSVTRAEFDQARGQLRERRGERRAERGPRRGGGMHRMHAMRGDRLFGEQGFVTRDQLEQRALARFDRLDADRNGTLTAAERRQGHERRRERIEERRTRTN